MSDDDMVRYADDAYEAVRSLNHATFRAIPAPLAYALLGNLQGVGYGLAQLLGQLSAGLTRSLAEYDVYDHNRDPVESVRAATAALREASTHAARIGELLAMAQASINLQGYHDHSDSITDDTSTAVEGATDACR
jgi:hypothetical protein